jgi:hypothetical protein
MTVAELVQKLSECPKDALVVADFDLDSAELWDVRVVRPLQVVKSPTGGWHEADSSAAGAQTAVELRWI